MSALRLGHALHADGERHRQGGRQALGDQRHHDAEGEEQRADPAEAEDDRPMKNSSDAADDAR